jgi:hypothetical protein
MSLLTRLLLSTALKSLRLLASFKLWLLVRCLGMLVFKSYM